MNWKKELTKIGITDNVARSRVLAFITKECKRLGDVEILSLVTDLANSPEKYLQHKNQAYRSLASIFVRKDEVVRNELLDEPKPYRAFCDIANTDKLALEQMNRAMRLPVSVVGALMPDAHAGYGLPIGGVLATDNVVIPYAVGLDIGCGMGLSLYDCGENYIERNKDTISRCLLNNTAFGMDGVLRSKHYDKLFDRKEFNEIPILKKLRDKAVRQLGTSGGGNHFVDVCYVNLNKSNPFGKVGEFTAILSHSGSRGFGAAIAEHFTKIAKNVCILPREAGSFAWLDMGSEDGILYWTCMNIAAEYASICHEIIHKNVSSCMRGDMLAYTHTHHNLAWIEEVGGKKVVVHRKGASPAHIGTPLVIPSSMGDYGVVCVGKGCPDSLSSASHGTGRVMSRQDARNTISGHFLKKYLAEKGVTLLGGTVEESPQSYRRMDDVLPLLGDCVEVVGIIEPKICIMSDGE